MANTFSRLVIFLDLGTTNKVLFDDLRLSAGLYEIKSFAVQLGAKPLKALKVNNILKSILNQFDRQPMKGSKTWDRTSKTVDKHNTKGEKNERKPYLQSYYSHKKYQK